MSALTAFAGGKRALRRGAFSLATIASLFAANGATAADFTPQECKIVYETSRMVVQALRKDTLSLKFRQSLVNFMGPDTRCNGPKNILTPTVNDVAAFNTIRGLLLSPPARISLQERGLRSVDPASVVSLKLN
jgi:hypothetical protein